MHIYIIYGSVNYAIIASRNGPSAVRRQAIIWTNIGPREIIFNDILIKIQTSMKIIFFIMSLSNL